MRKSLSRASPSYDYSKQACGTARHGAHYLLPNIIAYTLYGTPDEQLLEISEQCAQCLEYLIALATIEAYKKNQSASAYD